MSEIFSVAASVGNVLPLLARRGGGGRQQHPTTASALKWQAEPKPKPKPSKLQLLTSPLQSRESAPHQSLDRAEHDSPLAFFATDCFKDDFFTTSNLFFLSHRLQQSQESSERDDFYANMGSAIRTLRDETPFLFYKDLDYSIYREDIAFRDPRNLFIGIDKYKLIFWALRFHGQMFFKAIWIEVLRIWQPSDRVIVVRWTVRGIPRVPWEAQGLFEGTSEYKLDENGKIYEHRVDNVAPNSPSYFRAPALMELLTPAPCGTPTATYCKRSSLPLWMESAIARGSSWERFYLALTTTLDMHHWWIWYLAS